METKNGSTPVFPETQEAYEAPVIATVEVQVERGFQGSDKSDSLRNSPHRNPPSW